ncbi:glycosyltransferase [Atlantibacter subterraneus]|uniref:glycosyltransferase n=1 Tax=Atlantibacter subterraneus TaxID=255519 RepID=UPI002963E451|nr:glycosyltransferase [Atlantibacter subterranea]MDW2741445.1 glycosyltransferase [Atlantibacter subterranea]
MFQLESLGYFFDNSLNVWKRDDYTNIGYNDGDEEEERLAKIIRDAQDITVFSSELRNKCVDWQTLYHLTSQRGNVLRPFAHLLKGDVLEIGAGCGAISRFLGENGGNILALEGSERRASIAASRTRDLDNVHVIAERFDKFTPGRQFDAITLIGVLEYATMFGEGEHPEKDLLTQVRNLLKPGGFLFIAIENKLGLKYFAGAPEDHIRQPMYGIEGRYKNGEARTWGYEELSQLLAETGYRHSDVLLPFPDYKLPMSIITPAGSKTTGFDASALAVQSVFSDPQLPAHLTFSLQSCFPEIFKNNLGVSLANSFIFAASVDAEIPLDKSVLAYHYSTQRKKQYSKETIFSHVDNGEVNVSYHYFQTEEADSGKTNYIQIRKEDDKYYCGKLLGQKFINILCTDNWKFEDFISLMNQWLFALEKFIEKDEQHNFSLTHNADCSLPAYFIDAIPQNIIMTQGGPILFDIEWQGKGHIELGHLLFRGIILVLNQAKVRPLVGNELLTRRAFVQQVLAQLGIDATEDDLQRYKYKEAEFQHQVTGRDFDDLLVWHGDSPLAPVTIQGNRSCLYFASRGEDFAEENMHAFVLKRGRNTINWQVKGKNQALISKLRFDPVDCRCWFTIYSFIIKNSDGDIVWKFNDDKGIVEYQDILEVQKGVLNLYYSTSLDPQILLKNVPEHSELNIEVELEIIRDESLAAFFEKNDAHRLMFEQRKCEIFNEIESTFSELQTTTKEIDYAIEQLEIIERQHNLIIKAKVETTQQVDIKSGQLNKIKVQFANTKVQLENIRVNLGCAKVRLEDTTEKMDDLTVQLENTTILLDKTMAQLENATVQLENSTSDLVETNVRLNNAQSELESTSAQLASISSQLDSTTARLDASTAMLNEKNTQLDNTQAQLSAVVAQLTHSNAQLAVAMTRINALETSSSWKITASLRAVGKVRNQSKALASVTRRLYRQHGLKKIVSKGLGTLQREGWKGIVTRLRQQRMLQVMQIPVSPFPAATLTPGVEKTASQAQSAPVAVMQPTAITFNRAEGYQLKTGSNEYCYVIPAQPENLSVIISDMTVKPFFSIVVPIYNTPLDLLQELIDSIEAQWYPKWELVLANDCSTDPKLYEALESITNPQIKIVQLKTNSRISGATNVAIENATGDYIVFTDHDDLLTPDCLYEMAICINNEDPDFIYSDEDKLSEEGFYVQPHFKPDWSPDTMMSTMFTCHASCVKKSLLAKTGLLRSEFDGCQDWDFVLRVSEQTTKISHIPKVLYHWRIIPQSTASDIAAKDYVLQASVNVRKSALERRGLSGVVEPVVGPAGYFRVNYFPVGNPLVSIIIPTRDNYNVLRRCVESIKGKTKYTRYEIIILDNGSVAADALQYFSSLENDKSISIIHHNRPFNFSELNNVGVAHSKGEILLFLNDDTEVIHSDWLERLIGYAQLPHVGAVGAKLLYPETNLIQHAGVLNLAGGPMHAFHNTDRAQPGYFMRNLLEYNWLAVTGACLMIERSKFDRIGQFDESFPIAYNDIDLCFRSVDAGYYNVMCPAVELYHYESVSRGLDHQDEEKVRRLMNELSRLNEKHPHYYQYDPFFNINLHPNGINFEVGC